MQAVLQCDVGMMLWVPSEAPGAAGPQGGDAQREGKVRDLVLMK